MLNGTKIGQRKLIMDFNTVFRGFRCTLDAWEAFFDFLLFVTAVSVSDTADCNGENKNKKIE
jgi:hypothetical protein